MSILIRDAVAADFPSIVELNAEFVEYTSPMDRPRLEFLHSLAAYHRVAEADGEFCGFLFAMRRGAAYPNANFAWFSARYDDFLYIDRIVISRAQHGKGIGGLLYDNLFAYAGEHRIPLVCCEFNVVPPNEVSRRFHARRGFSERGSQWLGDGEKKVSMQVAEL